MSDNLNNQLKGEFSSISLSELNASASFLNRIDTKFLVTEKKFNKILKDLKKDFYVLEINWKNTFEYDSIYMDTEDYMFYLQHQAKEKSRTKIRTRLYVDSWLSFFEYKQKEKKVTRKFRYEFPNNEHWKMTKWKTRFYEWIHMSFYWSSNPPKLSPSLKTHYNRLTLCSKDNSERLTVDFNIEVENLRKDWKKYKMENLVIIESKTTSKNCLSHEVMEKAWIEKASHCSKYCLWMYYTWVKNFSWIFKKTIKKINKIWSKK